MIGGLKKKTEIPVVPLDECIAKTFMAAPGISVENHCKIVGVIAQNLISLYPQRLQDLLFPSGTDFIAACHDIGKVSPCFQKMIYLNISEITNGILSLLSDVNAGNAGRNTPGFHAAVSQVSADGAPQNIPEILGVHHGFTPVTSNFRKGCSLHGGASWQTEREELVDRLRRYFGFEEGFWPRYSIVQASVISGLVTVADWIGSGDFFASFSLEDTLSVDETTALAKKAIDEAGFRKIQVKSGLSFEDIFSFTPYEIQLSLISLARYPGVYILEAPMGIGKTEAALYAAYSLLERNLATGIYFALPTQLTSEKMFERMGKFLDVIIDPAAEIPRSRLLHSHAWLSNAAFGEDADVGGSWFDSSKRGLLAPFAVGTIDQALMAVMNVRHGFVRTFALAGKVIILDEVHSYDSYTGTILNRLISALRTMGCTVIVLSATLTARQRKSLLEINEVLPVSNSYPLVSGMVSGENSEFHELTSSTAETSEVSVVFSKNSDMAFVCALERAISGEQVLWIENTVAEAQIAYKRLAANARLSGIPCGLLHSRFLKIDRENIESVRVEAFGKGGLENRAHEGRILVGTQVLEQSLDIDADFLVSRLSPSDMLFQRIGRLWRHRQNDIHRPKSACRQVMILSPRYEDSISKPDQFGLSALVYSEYVLQRTLEAWKDIKTVTLPKDIRNIIEITYAERDEIDQVALLKKRMLEKRDTLQRLARVGLSRGIATLPESRATTRYSELDTVDVLLIRDMRSTPEGIELTLLDESFLLVPATCSDQNIKREVAANVIRNTVRVAEYIAPEGGQILSWLKPFVYVGSKDEVGEEPFRLGLVGKDGSITRVDGTCANEKYTLRYDSDIGYQTEKTRELTWAKNVSI